MTTGRESRILTPPTGGVFIPGEVMSCSTEILLQTRANPFRKGRSVNATNTAFPFRGTSTTNPFTANPSGDAGTATGSCVIELTDQDVGGSAQNGAEFIFYGVGADNTTFSARIYGISTMQTSGRTSVTPQTNLWIYVPLVELACTLSVQMTGQDNRVITGTENFADTLAIVGTTAVAGVDVNVTSPANDTIAKIYADLWGFQGFEVTYDMTGATSGNCAFRLL